MNMVHTYDVAAFIKYIIVYNLYDENYNIVASTHPSKSEFYGTAMRKVGNTEPIWLESDNPSKIVANKKSLATNFEYKYDDLLLAINSL